MTFHEGTHILYSGKFLRGSIFVERQSLLFCGFNFCGCGHSSPLCAVQSSFFLEFNFCGLAITRKSCENWIPRNFPTIWYVTLHEPHGGNEIYHAPTSVLLKVQCHVTHAFARNLINNQTRPWRQPGCHTANDKLLATHIEPAINDCSLSASHIDSPLNG